MLDGLHDVDWSLEYQVADFRMACIVGPTGRSAMVFFVSCTNVGTAFQKDGCGTYVSMEGRRVQRRVSAGGVDRGLRVVAHIHGRTGANEGLDNGSRRALAGADDERAPAIAGLKDCRVA